MLQKVFIKQCRSEVLGYRYSVELSSAVWAKHYSAVMCLVYM